MQERNPYDVIVVGLGPWGASAAWHLARRGVRVLGFDRHTPPHGYGSHGGATRLARQSNSTGPAYHRLTRRTFELWRQLSTEVGQDLLLETGTVFVGKAGSGWFDRTIESLATAEFEHEVVDPTPAQAKFPGFRIADDETTVFEPHGTVALVVESLYAMHDAARRHGAELRFDDAVKEYSVDADGVEVRTASGTYRANRLIVAVGAWSGQTLGLDLPVAVERQVLFNFAIPDGVRLETAAYFAAPPGDDSAPFYGCPEPDGSYKVSLPSRGNEIRPDELTEQQPTAEEVAAVRQCVRERIPALDGEPIRATVCMWSEVSDGHWIIGAHPRDERIVFGAGCMGRGFRYAPVVGEALADLATGTKRPDMAMFKPQRFPSIAGQQPRLQ